MNTIKRFNTVVVYYRSRSAKDNIYSIRVSRKCFDSDMVRLWLSDYRLRNCESDVCLCHGDVLEFSIEDDFSPAGLVDVYRSRSGCLYCACRG